MWWWGALPLGGLACDGGACPNASASRHKHHPPSREVSLQRAKLEWSARCGRAAEPASPQGCSRLWAARERKRADAPPVVLMAMLKKVEPASVVYFLEYHLLLGVQHVYIADNNCGADLETSAAAFRPYVDAGLLTRNTQLACVDIKGLSGLMSYELRGGSSAAARLLEAHLKPGTFVVGLDDDEYVVLRDPSKDLSDLAVRLRQKRVCAMQLLWKVYGSSHHECQPDGPFMREFTRRGKQMAELNQSGTSAMLKEVEEHNLNDPFLGKPVFFYWGPGATACGTHSCEHCPKGQSNCGQRRGPSAECEAMGIRRTEAWINHYFFQSKEHWTMKKLRGRTNHAPPRRGDAPESYDAVVDRAGAAALDRRVQSVRDAALRGCLARLFRTPLSNRTAPAGGVKHMPSKHTKHSGEGHHPSSGLHAHAKHAGSGEGGHHPSSRSNAQRKAPHHAALGGSQRPQKSKTPGGGHG